MSEWIIFLGASMDQVAGIRKCQEMGYRVMAFDQNPDAPKIQDQLQRSLHPIMPERPVETVPL